MAEIIERSPIGNELKDKFGIYAKYIIQDRALPDARDGLKPVQRRILYGMWEEGNFPDRPYRKAAKLVGAIMGNYHPHGDSSIYEAMTRLSQDWVVRHALVDLHGNNGSIDGDSPASMRYTEVRLTTLSLEYMLHGIEKKGVIPMMDNFDGSEHEPTVLPVQFPHLLINGISGISAGYATDILPHHLGETLRGASALLENPDITVAELMEYIPAPDFPTGGVITGAQNLQAMYETGKGAVTVRSRYHFEEEQKITRIVFTDIPYTLKKQKIVEKIDGIVVAKKVAGLLRAQDESGRDGLRITVDCQKGTEQTVLSYLFKHTGLQQRIHMNMVVVLDRKPQLINLKEALQAFTDFRKEIVIREHQYEKMRLEKRLHILDGFILLTEDVAAIVAVIQDSDGKADGRQKIMEQFGFTEAQAEAIVMLPLHRISKQDKKVYAEEKVALTKELTQVEAILGSEKKLVRLIIRGLDKLALQYSDERRTALHMEEEVWEVNAMDIIAEETVHVAVSKQGYVKRSSPRSYTATQACGVAEEDSIVFEGVSNTKHILALVTNHGRHTCVPVHHVDEMKWGDGGKHISAYTALNAGEEIIHAFTFVPEEVSDKYTFVVKTNGQVRMSPLEECKVSRKLWALSQYVKVLEGEEIAYTGIHSLEEAVGFTNHRQQKMTFALSEIPVTGMRAGGVRGIHLKKDEVIAGFELGTLSDLVAKGYPQRPRGSRGQEAQQPTLFE